VTRLFYTLLLYLAVPWALLRLLWRARRNPDYARRWAERFGYGRDAGAGPVAWVHAVSVGEVRASAPLVRAVRARYPELRWIVTTMTPTGSQQVAQLFGDTVMHCYVPWDLPGAVARFLARTRPILAIVMETEYWPNLFAACARRDVPIMVANVRMSERSMHRYLRVAGLTRETLGAVACFCVQSGADAQRMGRLGAPAQRVHVTGSMKFELDVPGSVRESAAVQRRDWGASRPVWIAASVHPGEEPLLIEVLHGLRKGTPELLVVVAPRHPERFAPFAAACERAGIRIALRSATRGQALDEDVSVYVADTMGELMLLYGASDVAFVGGSLVPHGGQNILEPAAMGIPVLFGPHMFNFAEIAQLALERNAAWQVGSSAELEHGVRRLLGDANLRDRMGQAGARMVQENRGALSNTLTLVDGLLESRGAVRSDTPAAEP